MKTMGKTRLKRLGLGLLQHILAVCIMVAVADLVLNSYIEIDTIDGSRVYKLLPFDAKLQFEESEIYHKLFRSAVSDITQLVVIKGQLETDGVLDPAKKIDVTEYARQIGKDQGCAISAVYDLDDIVKWGKYGMEYSHRIMGMSEFVNYFGYCLYPENFTLDEYGKLCFDAFNKVSQAEENPTRQEEYEDSHQEPPEEGAASEEGEMRAQIAGMLEEYTQAQLEDLVLSYIMAKNPTGVDMSREDDGRLIVMIPMLNCRYPTADGIKQLTACADNWVDYMLLQDNVAATIDSLTESYQRYQVCNEAYKEGNSNVNYVVRMMTDDGMRTYTNVERFRDLDDNEITEAFNEYRRYLIYYPDSLVYMGNTFLSEEEINDYISLYEYAYPDTTHIWLGIDANYAIEGDAFNVANAAYQRVVPNVNILIRLMMVLALVWLGLGIYLTVTVDETLHRDAGTKLQLGRFDRIWTEALVLLAAGLVYVGALGYRGIMDIAGTAGAIPTQMLGIQLTNFYRYGMFAVYGLYVSAAFNLVWHSLVRRMRADNFWKDSFLYFLCMGIGGFARLIFRHKSSAISTLLPYNCFLFLNLAGIVAVYRLWDRQIYVLLILGGMVALDVVVGALLLRLSAEQSEIVEGIRRIRDGEVEFKLDLDNLHGSSREMADAVNNIGEGIRKAVKTSMKDEQMKTDLITNVSHDIKTPLTSIINYVDLLKRLKIEEEPAKGYIAILDGKAQRLKQLTDDLVEASKISSGNIVLNKERLNLAELLNQGLGEFSERLEECGLQVIFEGRDGSAYIYADSSRMWRVVENLFNNICKYAMEGTRVYIDLVKKDGLVEVSVKNISRQQMNIRPDELSERFIRGDSARTTEGSGLGLSIAKSLVQVQGGSFEILLDGDLFKVMLCFPEY